ncbi:MAG: hypothetical protein FJW39_26345 [Acidobacteria bacterium]|nr:hypothetical protein [Acidobacteriota bacterium]
MSPELFAAIERGASVITAHHRLARALSHDYSAEKCRQGSAAWREPYIVPWFGWLERSWRDLMYIKGEAPPAPLTAWQEEMLWESAVASSPEAEDLLQPGATARAARRAWTTVHAWRLPVTGPWWEQNEDAAAFAGWARRFQERCDGAGRLDPAVLADFLRPRLIAPRELWFAGFDELTLQQRELADSLEAGGASVVRLESGAAPPAPARLRVFPDPELELAAAADWADVVLRNDPAATIGVLIPEIRGIGPAAARIFEDILGSQVHVAGAQSLAAAPAVHAALRMIELARPTIPAAVLSSLLLSPHVDGFMEEASARARFDARLRGQGRIEWSWRAVRRMEHCPPVFGGALAEWEPAADEAPVRQRPSSWAKLLSRLLGCLGWSAPTARIQRAWEHVLADFSSLDSFTGDVAVSRALALVKRIAGRSQLGEENRGQPVQVMSIEESAGLEFSHLWVCGFSETAWPRPSNPLSFIPVALQRERNLPHSSPARELDYARTVTRRLLASAGEVVVSYSREDGDQRLGPSPLVAHLPREAGPDGGRRSGPGVVLESVEETHGPAVDPDAWQTGGTRVLQLQASCPFRAYAEIRLGARPIEDPELGLDPREKGKVLHTAMELLWRELGGSERLRAMSAETLARIVTGAIEQALRTERGFASTPFEERLRVLESRRLARLLHEWLEIEKTRAGDFVAVEIEAKREIEIAGLRLRTRTDRADRIAGGQLVLIDYKSGEPSLKSWEGDRPGEPQVPLYAVTHDEPIAGTAFAQIRTGSVQFKGYASRDGLLPKTKVLQESEFEATLSQWRKALEDLAREFLAGRAEVAPKSPEECTWCHLKAACRIRPNPGENNAG